MMTTGQLSFTVRDTCTKSWYSQCHRYLPVDYKIWSLSGGKTLLDISVTVLFHGFPFSWWGLWDEASRSTAFLRWGGLIVQAWFIPTKQTAPVPLLWPWGQPALARHLRIIKFSLFPKWGLFQTACSEWSFSHINFCTVPGNCLGNARWFEQNHARGRSYNLTM